MSRRHLHSIYIKRTGRICTHLHVQTCKQRPEYDVVPVAVRAPGCHTSSNGDTKCNIKAFSGFRFFLFYFFCPRLLFTYLILNEGSKTAPTEVAEYMQDAKRTTKQVNQAKQKKAFYAKQCSRAAVTSS